MVVHKHHGRADRRPVTAIAPGAYLTWQALLDFGPALHILGMRRVVHKRKDQRHPYGISQVTTIEKGHPRTVTSRITSVEQLPFGVTRVGFDTHKRRGVELAG